MVIYVFIIVKYFFSNFLNKNVLRVSFNIILMNSILKKFKKKQNLIKVE